MIVQTRFTLNRMLLAGMGLGLILVGFLLLLEPSQRNAVAWLDLAVCGIAFLFNFATLPLVQLRSKGFSSDIPKLGILWTTHALYTSLALGGIWFGWSTGVAFRLQLLYHLVLLFGTLTVVSVAGKAAEHADRVAATELHQRDSLQTLKGAVADCDVAFLRLGDSSAEYAEFQRIKEAVRYLSPCDAPAAVSLDLEIACLLEELCSTLASSNQFPGQTQNTRDALNRCRTLVQLRKQERQV